MESCGSEISRKYIYWKRNAAYCMMRCIASADGGTGRSAGRWGNKEGMSSGWFWNSGVRLVGVRTSVRESSME